MAQKAQQTILSVSTAQAAAKTITGITSADPGVVSAAAHGYSINDIVLIDGVVGMTQVNNRAFVVYNTSSPLPTGTFQLKGVDTSLSTYSTYTSGGSAYKQTMTEIAQVRTFTAFDGEDNDIDVTHLRSIAEESLTGVPRTGNMQMTLWLPSTVDIGQRKLQTLRESQSQAVFSIQLSSGLIAAFVGRVKSFSVSGAVDGAIECNCSIKLASKQADFA
jgi:hypothetical protein